MGEIIFLIIMGALLVVPWWINRLWWWAGLFTSITVGLLITELVSKLTTGMTISQQFWKFSLESGNDTAVVLTLGAMTIGIIMLDIHLLWKWFKKKDKWKNVKK